MTGPNRSPLDSDTDRDRELVPVSVAVHAWILWNLQRMYVHAAIEAALLFDFSEPQPANLSCRSHMCTATRLKIDELVALAYSNQPNLAASAWRLDRHRFHEPGICRQFLVRNPFVRDFKVPFHQIVQ